MEPCKNCEHLRALLDIAVARDEQLTTALSSVIGGGSDLIWTSCDESPPPIDKYVLVWLEADEVYTEPHGPIPARWHQHYEEGRYNFWGWDSPYLDGDETIKWWADFNTPEEAAVAKTINQANSTHA